MTYAAPAFDYYDDGLVHGHEWSRATPPGTHHSESVKSRPASTQQQAGSQVSSQRN
jgi:hypothetical protein